MSLVSISHWPSCWGRSVFFPSCQAHPLGGSAVSKHPVVFRFASVRPAQLARIRMHARRAAGDLDHIHPSARSVPVAARNEFIQGGEPPEDDWVERFKRDLDQAALDNREAKAQAAEARGKMAEARRIRRSPPTKPYREGRGGPLREGILTASADWFAADPKRLVTFRNEAMRFLKQHFGKALLHVRYDLDEAAPHFHFVVAPWCEEKTKGGATVKVLRPSSLPLVKNYEAAQDAVGAHFAPLGLVRGERRWAMTKAALLAGIEPPPRRHHKTPSAYRKDLRERETTAALAVQGALAFKAEALEDVAQTLDRGMRQVAAERAALAEQAKAVRADARHLGLAISNATGKASEYEANPASPEARAAVERAAAMRAAQAKKAAELRQAAAKKAIRREAIKAQQRERGGRQRER